MGRSGVLTPSISSFPKMTTSLTTILLLFYSVSAEVVTERYDDLPSEYIQKTNWFQTLNIQKPTTNFNTRQLNARPIVSKTTDRLSKSFAQTLETLVGPDLFNALYSDETTAEKENY